MADKAVSPEETSLGYSGCEVYLAQRIRTDDAVKRQGTLLTLAEAISERKAGRDVVVCGVDVRTNLIVAETIEARATGNCHQRHPVHLNLGNRALPHFQHRVRKNLGHTFYESPPDRLAVKGSSSL